MSPEQPTMSTKGTRTSRPSQHIVLIVKNPQVETFDNLIKQLIMGNRNAPIAIDKGNKYITIKKKKNVH